MQGLMPETMCRIAHISDLHIAHDGAVIFDLVDTVKATKDIVAALNTLSPAPDLVLVTGDITHEGDESAAQIAMDILCGLHMPFRIANGNHDCRNALVKALPLTQSEASNDDMGAGDFVHVTEIAGLRCIALDTAVSDPRKSAFSSQQLCFLERTLKQGKGKPAVVFMHHPPFDTGVPWLDEMQPEKGRHELGSLIQNYPEVLALLCGHLHRPMLGEWYGTPVYAGPSVMNPLDLALHSEGDEITLRITAPPGYVLYDIAPSGTMTASLQYLEGHTESWQQAIDWQETLEQDRKSEKLVAE